MWSAEDPASVAALRRLLAEIVFPTDVSRLSDQEVLEQLTWRLRSGHGTIDPWAPGRKRPTTAGSAVRRQRREEPADDEPAGEILPPEEPEQTWIEVRLLDEEGEPVPNERYRLELPDGSVREGRLDANGHARVDEVENPGDCRVSFPDYHS